MPSLVNSQKLYREDGACQRNGLGSVGATAQRVAVRTLQASTCARSIERRESLVCGFVVSLLTGDSLVRLRRRQRSPREERALVSVRARWAGWLTAPGRSGAEVQRLPTESKDASTCGCATQRVQSRVPQLRHKGLDLNSLRYATHDFQIDRGPPAVPVCTNRKRSNKGTFAVETFRNSTRTRHLDLFYRPR